MPEPAELVELFDAELAAAESSAELVEVDVDVDVDASPLVLVPGGTVVMLGPNPGPCPSPLLQAARAARVASARRRIRSRYLVQRAMSPVGGNAPRQPARRLVDLTRYTIGRASLRA